MSGVSKTPKITYATAPAETGVPRAVVGAYPTHLDFLTGVCFVGAAEARGGPENRARELGR
eukprot:4872854-Prymnesium_polylepis.1